jgi:hypothetical protein
MSTKPPPKEIAEYFNQHCAPLYFHFNKGEENHHYVISTFVISIDDEWFLVTAGHCLGEIENIKSAGYSLAKVRLIDYGGLNAKHFDPIPFDYENSSIEHLGDDNYDYGIIYISKYYRRLLESNNIIALNEEVWEKQPSEPDSYYLLGVPDQLTEVAKGEISIRAVLLQVTKCDSVPDEFEKTDAPTFYGEIYVDEDLTSIKGMSGGPLFSFEITESGQYKYWLCAVQSRWLPRKRLIAACLMKPFASLVRDSMREIWRGKV